MKQSCCLPHASLNQSCYKLEVVVACSQHLFMQCPPAIFSLMTTVSVLCLNINKHSQTLMWKRLQGSSVARFSKQPTGSVVNHITLYTHPTAAVLNTIYMLLHCPELVNSFLQRRRRRRDAIGHEAEQCWQHLQAYLHGCQAFAEDEGSSTALQRHLVRTTATSLLDRLLHYQVTYTLQLSMASGPGSVDICCIAGPLSVCLSVCLQQSMLWGYAGCG